MWMENGQMTRCAPNIARDVQAGTTSACEATTLGCTLPLSRSHSSVMHFCEAAALSARRCCRRMAKRAAREWRSKLATELHAGHKRTSSYVCQEVSKAAERLTLTPIAASLSIR